jgi:hypothetical protein
MITLELLEEFCDSFTHPDFEGGVTSYKLYNTADGFTFIHIIFEYSWNSVRLDLYYEWLNRRRNSKLESIGI